MDTKFKISRIIKLSLILSLCLFIYFLFVRNLGYADRVELRMFNFLFLLGFGYYFQRELWCKGANYLQSGILNTIMLSLGVFFFATLMLIYGNLIDPTFGETIINSQNLPVDINYSIAVFIVLVEGVSSSMIASFILLQWYKNKLVKTKAEEKVL